MRRLKLGSLFDGIGGWPLAAVRNGVEPVWASEIERFPIEVTKRRFPNMKHLGSVTEINGAEIEPVDIITSGSPCQDLSIAGKRAGLKGERSGLFNDSIRIVREMRAATNGQYPTLYIWENVPGVFSSNSGRDFLAVLQALSETHLPMPESGKWAGGGMVRGRRCDIAWRVLDAQHWGCAQRRRRVFLICDFRATGRVEILFKPESLPRHPQEVGQPWQGTSCQPEKRADAAGRSVGTSLTSNSLSSGNILDSHERGGEMRSFNPSERDNGECYAIAGNTIDRKPENGGNGKGYQQDVSYTLTAFDRHAIACNLKAGTLQGKVTTSLTTEGTSGGDSAPKVIVPGFKHGVNDHGKD